MSDVVKCIEGFSVAPDGMESLPKEYLKREKAAHQRVVSAMEDARMAVQAALDKGEDGENERVQADSRIKDAQAELAQLRRKERPKMKGRLKAYRQGRNYAKDDPGVIANPDKFQDIEEWIERGTAAPGELRINKPRQKATSS